MTDELKGEITTAVERLLLNVNQRLNIVLDAQELHVEYCDMLSLW
jgi:hypothetical protein